MNELREGLKRILTDSMQTYEDKVKEIKGLFKEAGYVKLAEAQSLPDVWVRDIPSGKLVQEDMWNKSWRKVEL